MFRVFHADQHAVPLPEGHRFPMQKYRVLRERLVSTGVLRPEQLCPAPLAEAAAILAVHGAEYVQAFLTGSLERERERRIGFPWSEALVRRTLASTGGTLAAARAALEDGFAGALAGGTHHAHRDFGSGYCVFNDIAVAAVALLEGGHARRVLVVDLDVHQGDGTAAIFAGDPRVFTLSVHGARNFPARKACSDLDVALPDETGDAVYLDALDGALQEAVERSRPDFIFYQAGVDALGVDRLGRLALTLDGMGLRDERVFELASRLGVPLVTTLGGGYADPIEPTIEAHVQTYRAARAQYGVGAP